MDTIEQQKLEDAMRVRYPLFTAWREFKDACCTIVDLQRVKSGMLTMAEVERTMQMVEEPQEVAQIVEKVVALQIASGVYYDFTLTISVENDRPTYATITNIKESA